MKALLSRIPGGAESLSVEEIEESAPGPNEVLVRVRACGVNYSDTLLIRDLYQVKPPRPFSPGAEVCGDIERIGEGVAGLVPGDRVIGRCGWGGMAEKLVLTADRCVRIPPDAPVAKAAAFLFSYATAYHALTDRAGLQRGETLLVLGAAGGVGSAAIQIGCALGARVLAAASSEEKLDFARGIGAQGGYVYPAAVDAGEGAKALAAGFKELTGKAGADVIFDPVGGVYTEAALRSIARDGRHLVVGFTAGIPKLPLNLTLLKSCQVIGVDWRTFIIHHAARNEANTADLLRMWREGTLSPPDPHIYRLEHAAQAIARLAARDVAGKLVVSID